VAGCDGQHGCKAGPTIGRSFRGRPASLVAAQNSGCSWRAWFYAAGLSVIDTCRKRGVDPWTYARDLIAAARKGSSLPSIPAKLAA